MNMKKKKSSYIVLLLPVVTFCAVLGYCYYKYKNSNRVVKSVNVENNVAIKHADVLENIDSVDEKLNKNSNYLISMLNISIEKDKDIPKNVAIGNDESDIKKAFDTLKQQLKTDANDEAIVHLTKIVHQYNSGLIGTASANETMLNIIKYLAVSELEKQIILGLNYDKHIDLMMPLVKTDKDLVALVNTIKSRHVFSSAEIMHNYLKIAEQLDYEVYFQIYDKNLFNKIFFKIKRYVGIHKNDYNDIDSVIKPLLLKKEYDHIIAVLQPYIFINQANIDFKNDLLQIIAVEKMFANVKQKCVLKISELSK